MKRLELDENTKSFVAVCRGELQRLQVEFKTTTDLMNKQLTGIAERAGLKGNLELSVDGAFLSIPEVPASEPVPEPV